MNHLFCLALPAVFQFHIISILFNCIRVTKAMMGTKVVPLYFMFALFLESRATTRAEDLRPFVIS